MAADPKHAKTVATMKKLLKKRQDQAQAPDPSKP
jgi:hypothetical protein